MRVAPREIPMLLIQQTFFFSIGIRSFKVIKGDTPPVLFFPSFLFLIFIYPHHRYEWSILTTSMTNTDSLFQGKTSDTDKEKASTLKFKSRSDHDKTKVPKIL